jgi:ParB family chromosome partitioning protein
MQVLAVCTSLSIDGVAGNEQSHAINALAGALNMNLSAYWQPTRESYLDHVSKDRIVAIIGDVVSPDEGKRLAKMKKGEAATAAETLLKGKNWLPEFMAAAEVNEAFFGDGEDDEDEDVEASGSDGDADTADEAEAALAADEQAVHANADCAPWPFPKAADFVAEASTTAPVAVSVARSPCTALATLSPAAAWPFPPSKLAALRSTLHAA